MQRRLAVGTLVLLAATVACGQSNPGTVIATQPAGQAPAPTPPRIQRSGDVIQFSDHTVTLTSARITGEDLHTSFTVTNTGNADVNVVSGIAFDARLPDGTRLERNLWQCTGAGLDGRILPGESLKGSLCWQGVTGNLVRIYYISNLFDSGATVWEVQR